MAAPSELHALEHLKHGVEQGQHDHVALHQPVSIQGCSLNNVQETSVTVPLCALAAHGPLVTAKHFSKF